VTSGNVTVEVNVSAPQGSQSRAVRYTWTGCHMIEVAIGTSS
jgi:hypothetical protein